MAVDGDRQRAVTATGAGYGGIGLRPVGAWIRRHRAATATLVVLTALTLLLASSAPVHFHLRWPGAGVPLETAGGVVAGLAAALAYLCFSFTGFVSLPRWAADE